MRGTHRLTILVAVLALAACDGGEDAVLGGKAVVDAARDSLTYLDALENRVFTLVDLDRETGRLTPIGSLEDLREVRREALGATLETCSAKARDQLVLAIDQIVRSQTDTAIVGAAWDHLVAYRRAAEACDDWLAAQFPS